jgi:hypothetical protein
MGEAHRLAVVRLSRARGPSLDGMTTPIRRLAVLAAALTLTGCGVANPLARPHRENPDSPPADIAQMVACFRAHGMPNWPDSAYDPRDGRWHLDGPPLKDETRQACAAVIPHATPPSPVPSAQFQDLLRYAQCLRAHGVPDWPDPTVDGAFVTDLSPKTDPGIQAAGPACERYLASSGGHLQIRPAHG